ncbi:hypothetical protein HNQ59_001879 [Chitinivorax tropicus]|uniref:DUF2199 domain-containing protein n=1 Tax=Chitinivorax tropicus TaxID=714531 RepID=A0A840MIW0_9PROT|nr:DUF2199 domain-containing protein [Chitinivorax tropicus]MBB5018588.1 hypothetical protein [Chitinivorax tropicus]
MPGYQCNTCGAYHATLPTSYGAVAPDVWLALPEAEREERAVLSSDQCIVDGHYFFILGRLEIPLNGEAEPFSWLVWVSLSKADFGRANELWETAGREVEPPYDGWLCTSLPCYPSTLRLKVKVHTRPVGHRPFVELLPCDHPLYLEQRDGVDLTRVQALAEALMHAEGEMP